MRASGKKILANLSLDGISIASDNGTNLHVSFACCVSQRHLRAHAIDSGLQNRAYLKMRRLVSRYGFDTNSEYIFDVSNCCARFSLRSSK